MTQRQRLNKMVCPANHDVVVMMNTETCLTLHGNHWQGTSYFTSPTKEVGTEVKFIPHTKFLKKMLLWLTISEKGMSKFALLSLRTSVSGEIYSTKCLPEVASFIKKHQKTEDAVFWPDLASAHYSKRSLEGVEQLNTDVVPKLANPPNVPKLRPIEDFWPSLKRKIYSNNIVAKTNERIKKTTCLHACFRLPWQMFHTPLSVFNNIYCTGGP
ncbi:uncharacterized protein LOC129724554 [Wyeomyia smithii]|uniref:uncharacterized protein LOC129724554 n=1 Tax=Wyeomyia smithii TaxID=174621 RepID=UPI002467F0BA|nr:uncharacterized protein LOC129724554 [Wyeomyia smithii]